MTLIEAAKLAQPRLRELAAQVAGWHIGDGDECGVVARELLTLLNQEKLILDFEQSIITSTPEREWQGLTDEEIETLMDTYDVASTDYARAIEAKLKEKNT